MLVGGLSVVEEESICYREYLLTNGETNALVGTCYGGNARLNSHIV